MSEQERVQSLIHQLDNGVVVSDEEVAFLEKEQ